ncbi:MAG TPA: glycogen debranching N-terminal domain-containing protein [Candidatus Limnocylindria bacterium]|nr:glycogen debranching N-terminal domain-containing protein [Candidatus Limnocylindria bacterium]
MAETRLTAQRRDPDDMFADKAPIPQTAVRRATDLTGVHVLKHDDLFMLSDAFGDAQDDRRGLGLYHGDTRVLSAYGLRINGVRPIVLRAGSAASYRATIQLTNPDLLHPLEIEEGAELVLRRHSLGVVRERLVSHAFTERVRVDNFTVKPERARLTLVLDADYADIFEVRGVVRERRGERLPTRGDGGQVIFGYRGLDGRTWRTHVRLSPAMALLDAGARVQATGEVAAAGDGPARLEQLPERGPVLLEHDWTLPPGGHRTLEITVWSEVEKRAGRRRPTLADDLTPAPVDEQGPAAMHRAWRRSSTSIETSHLHAARALERALADLRLLVNSGPQPDERYIAAGVPWFSCLFGRDSLITALQLLPIRPQVAQATLAILARLQATEIDEWRDAQPGKILHELRAGELALAGEIPHSPYYGTVDATPLWLMLLDEYQRWTGDDDLVDSLWPNALAALRWIEEYGDADGDGFVEYQRHSSKGLANQGWKDSWDAIRNRDGLLAEPPIALVEVQAYVYAARRGLARLAGLRGEEELAERQVTAAERLRHRFEEAFWMEDVGCYALALDGSKRQVDAISSNAGHALWCGIASPARAARVAGVLTGQGMWSGWGIRTLSSETVGYNPIGYHLGTIWPHDNGICAAGFARYGLDAEVRKVAGAMLEASMNFRDARMPELFCGFDRTTSPLPVPYPVACSPQAWAAGSLFHLVGATLGLAAHAGQKRLELVSPSLPELLPDLRIRNLRVGQAVVDLAFGGNGSISVEVLRRSGDLDVVVRL